MASTAPQPVGAVQREETWSAVFGLPCVLSVGLTVTEFTVRHLLSLDKGTVVDSGHTAGSQVPVWVNGVSIGWAEFDVLRTRLAIRISELV